MSYATIIAKNNVPQFQTTQQIRAAILARDTAERNSNQHDEMISYDIIDANKENNDLAVAQGYQRSRQDWVMIAYYPLRMMQTFRHQGVLHTNLLAHRRFQRTDAGGAWEFERNVGSI